MTATDSSSSPSAVVVQAQAFVSIALHAICHKTDPVHGILLGTSKQNTIVVQDSVPVCHGAPTRPIVEACLGLVADRTVVGWYTVPMLKDDTHPGPVALRMAASLNSPSVEPTLLVLDNVALGKLIKAEGDIVAIKAYGKDFGQQWLKPIACTVENSAGARRATREAVQQQVQLNDFVDHLEGSASTFWYPNNDISKIVASSC